MLVLIGLWVLEATLERKRKEASDQYDVLAKPVRRESKVDRGLPL
jgi:hypothetical protein